MTFDKLPPLEAIRGVAFEQTYTVTGEGVAMDLSGHTCTFLVARQFNEPEWVAGTITADDDGLVTLSLTAAQTLALEPQDTLGLHRVGVFQVEMLSDDGTDDFMWQGDFYLRGRIE